MIVSRDTSGGSYRPLAVPFQVCRDQVSRDLKRSLESHASGDALDDGVTTSFLPPLDATRSRSPAPISIRLYGLNPLSSQCLLATLNCSSTGGLPIVAQNKIPKSAAEKIVMATSLKYIGSTPH